MHPRSPSSLVAVAVLVAGAGACSSGPAPRDLSNASPIPIQNESAQVLSERVVTEVQDSPGALAVLAEPDRGADDRSLDAPRQAADLLTYLDVKPGMRVAELGAGGGYFTELLARSVGQGGAVYAVNPPSLTRGSAVVVAWGERLRRPANARVVRVDRELGAPLPTASRELDLVYLPFFYRDLPSVGVERRALLANVHDALRPGGRFVVLDRATPETPSHPLDLHAMHAEESRNARYEIERAGFRLVTEGTFLRASTATGAWDHVASDQPTPLETQDRFVLTFVKGRGADPNGAPDRAPDRAK